MIEQNLEFFNVDHLERVQGMNGLRLERFPEHFSRQLGIKSNCNGRFRAKRVHGCEIRFVTEAPYFDIALSAVEADTDICVYYGDMAHGHYRLQAGKVTVIHVEKHVILETVDEAELPRGRFSPGVWRIQFGMNGYAFFHYLDTFGHEYRPPEPGGETGSCLGRLRFVHYLRQCDGAVVQLLHRTGGQAAGDRGDE